MQVVTEMVVAQLAAQEPDATFARVAPGAWDAAMLAGIIGWKGKPQARRWCRRTSVRARWLSKSRLIVSGRRFSSFQMRYGRSSSSSRPRPRRSGTPAAADVFDPLDEGFGRGPGRRRSRRANVRRYGNATATRTEAAARNRDRTQEGRGERAQDGGGERAPSE